MRHVAVVVVDVRELVSRVSCEENAARGNVVGKHTVPPQRIPELVNELTGNTW